MFNMSTNLEGVGIASRISSTKTVISLGENYRYQPIITADFTNCDSLSEGTGQLFTDVTTTTNNNMYLKSSIQTSSIDYIKENIHITLNISSNIPIQ